MAVDSLIPLKSLLSNIDKNPQQYQKQFIVWQILFIILIYLDIFTSFLEIQVVEWIYLIITYNKNRIISRVWCFFLWFVFV